MAAPNHKDLNALFALSGFAKTELRSAPPVLPSKSISALLLVTFKCKDFASKRCSTWPSCRSTTIQPGFHGSGPWLASCVAAMSQDVACSGSGAPHTRTVVLRMIALSRACCRVWSNTSLSCVRRRASLKDLMLGMALAASTELMAPVISTSVSVTPRWWRRLCWRAAIIRRHSR